MIEEILYSHWLQALVWNRYMNRTIPPEKILSAMIHFVKSFRKHLIAIQMDLNVPGYFGTHLRRKLFI